MTLTVAEVEELRRNCAEISDVSVIIALCDFWLARQGAGVQREPRQEMPDVWVSFAIGVPTAVYSENNIADAKGWKLYRYVSADAAQSMPATEKKSGTCPRCGGTGYALDIE